MRRFSILAAALATAAASIGLAAQDHPNFAGKWVLDAAKSDAGTAGGAARGRMGRGQMSGGMGWGQEFTITQDAATLKVQRDVGGNPIAETYALDGTETKNSVSTGRGDNVAVTSTAKWDGAKLVIESKQPMNMGGNAMAMSTKRTLSIDASGGLVVETTRSGMQGNGMATKLVYKKQP